MPGALVWSSLRRYIALSLPSGLSFHGEAVQGVLNFKAASSITSSDPHFLEEKYRRNDLLPHCQWQQAKGHCPLSGAGFLAAWFLPPPTITDELPSF